VRTHHVLWISAAALSFVTWAGLADAKSSCTDWKAVDGSSSEVSLRTCDKGGAPKLEAKARIAKPKKVRLEITSDDGTTGTVEATLKRGINKLGDCASCKEHPGVKSARLATGAAMSATANAADDKDDKDDKATKDAKDASADAADGPAKKVKGNAHMEVIARDLKLSDVRAARLDRIATRYFDATKRRLVITGGSRPPDRQARLILEKLNHGDDVEKLYENKQAIGEIISAYRSAKASHAKKMTIERTTRDIIEAQMKRGVFISRHLKSGAADVRSRGMSASQEAALKDAVSKEAGVTLLDERNGPEPHFHLSL
jgi:hypothetical protein